MNPTPTGWDELHLAENPSVELLESLGYTYVPPEALEPERASLKETILAGRLATALKRLNPWLSETNVAKAVKTVTQVPAASLAEANEKVYTSLTYGIALEQDRGGGRKSHTVRFLDFDRPDRNEWMVTRQYRVLGSKKHVIPDIVTFVNGLPLAIIECKSPTIGDAWKAEAVKQLRRYQEADTGWKDQGAPRLFEAAQVLVGTCGERAVYGTVGTPERFFLEWKEPYPLRVEQLGERFGRAPTRQDVLLYGLLEPRNLLDVVRNFVAFEVDGGRTVRKLTRYRQFIAVNEAMRRIRTARRPSARGGVVWHTQGSGKSLTMLWLALKLRRDEAQQQPAVVIVTDRTKLDRQIAGVFTACGFPNPERADSVRDLRGILEHPTGRTVMTTIQKFQEITGAGGAARRGAVHPTLSEAANIFVMVDEAHRTQYRSLAANMRQALPNACFLGFTGTPIDKKDRSTLRTFGPYIDTRLEEIIEQRRQERVDAAQQLSLLSSLREELQGEQARAHDIGLDARGFAIYGLLERHRPMTAREDSPAYDAANRDLASLLDEAVAPFTELVDWWQKDDVQRQMRSRIKRQLRASGIAGNEVEGLAADIVDLAKVRTDR